MSKWWDDPEDIERRIARALVVAEYGPDDVDALDYLAAAKNWD